MAVGVLKPLLVALEILKHPFQYQRDWNTHFGSVGIETSTCRYKGGETSTCRYSGTEIFIFNTRGTETCTSNSRGTETIMF